MPQLNKGGKFVFGLSVIRSDLTIHIPPQALLEYDTTRDGKVIIFSSLALSFLAIRLNYSFHASTLLPEVQAGNID